MALFARLVPLGAVPITASLVLLFWTGETRGGAGPVVAVRRDGLAREVVGPVAGGEQVGVAGLVEPPGGHGVEAGGDAVGRPVARVRALAGGPVEKRPGRRRVRRRDGRRVTDRGLCREPDRAAVVPPAGSETSSPSSVVACRPLARIRPRSV
jgi:hypothetical protein